MATKNARKRWTLTLNMSTIRQTVRELEEYSKRLEPLTRETVHELAEYGARKATENFANAMYAGTNDAYAIAVEGKWGWRVKSQGKAAPFIEYGAGVELNGSTRAPGYPDTPKIPSGIVDIGTYGKGRGSNSFWAYYGEPGTAGWRPKKNRYGANVSITRGWKPNMCMANALRDIRTEAPQALDRAVRKHGLV